MNQKPESGMDRLKKVALWQWGLITIVAGVFANMVMSFQAPTGGSAAARGQAAGRGIATLLFVLIGIALIVVDVIRRRRK